MSAKSALSQYPLAEVGVWSAKVENVRTVFPGRADRGKQPQVISEIEEKKMKVE